MKMMKQNKWKFLVVAVFVALFLASCAPLGAGKGTAQVSTDCTADVRFETESEKGRIIDFKCLIEPFRGEDVVWYAFEVKNVSDEPARFIVRVIPEEGPAFSGLVPRTGEPKDFPVLAPGEKQAAKYPMNTLKEIPPRLTVVVDEELR